VKVTQYAEPMDVATFEKFELPVLPHDISYFALANFHDKCIFLTGGRDSSWEQLDKVYAFDLQ